MNLVHKERVGHLNLVHEKRTEHLTLAHKEKTEYLNLIHKERTERLNLVHEERAGHLNLGHQEGQNIWYWSTRRLPKKESSLVELSLAHPTKWPQILARNIGPAGKISLAHVLKYNIEKLAFHKEAKLKD